jgi:hypothetical protein
MRTQEQNQQIKAVISALPDDLLRKVFHEMFMFNTFKEKSEDMPCDNAEILLEVIATIMPAEDIKKASNITEEDEEAFDILYALELFSFTYKKVTVEFIKRFHPQ